MSEMESGDSTMGSSCSADRRRFGVAMLGAQEETHAAQGDGKEKLGQAKTGSKQTIGGNF